MAKVEKIKKSEKSEEDIIRMFGDWRENAKLVMEERQKEKDNIEHHINLLTIQKNQLEANNAREETKFEQWKRLELQKFENEKHAVMNELYKKQHAVDRGLEEHSKRMQDLEKREENVKKLEDEKHSLSLKQIEVENLMIRANALIEDGHSKLSVADDKLNKVSEIEHKNKDEAKRLKGLLEDLNKNQDELLKNQSIVKSQTDNLEAIRKQIEPKILEFKKIEEKIKLDKEAVDNKLKELHDKIVEEKDMMDKLGLEKQAVESKKKELNQREEEFKRKSLLDSLK